MKWILTALLVLGGMICCLNFYSTFIAYQLYRLKGGQEEEYHGSSGIPFIGSLLVAVSLFEFWHQPWIFIMAISLLLIDTAGPLWLAGFLIYQHFGSQRK